MEELKTKLELILEEINVRFERVLEVVFKTLEATKILLILFPFNKYLIAFTSPETSNLYAGIWEPIPTFPILSFKIFVPDNFEGATDSSPVPSLLKEASYKRDRILFTRLECLNFDFHQLNLL